ncbi:MAG: hypothetical protein GY773_32765 [Actinomycetia bacterium]|nr:hypothetical protein [Actinomycetes bacterium]
MSVRGEAMIGESGGLIGPFNAFLYSPTITEPIGHTGDLLRSETVIERSLLELAITVVLGHWRAEFAFGGHVAMAVDHGLNQQIIDAIVAGTEPEFGSENLLRVCQTVEEAIRWPGAMGSRGVRGSPQVGCSAAG